MNWEGGASGEGPLPSALLPQTLQGPMAEQAAQEIKPSTSPSKTKCVYSHKNYHDNAISISRQSLPHRKTILAGEGFHDRKLTSSIRDDPFTLPVSQARVPSAHAVRRRYSSPTFPLRRRWTVTVNAVRPSRRTEGHPLTARPERCCAGHPTMPGCGAVIAIRQVVLWRRRRNGPRLPGSTSRRIGEDIVATGCLSA